MSVCALSQQLHIKDAVDAMCDGFFVLNHRGIVVFWNRSMENLTGYTADMVIGKPCAQLQCNTCFGRKCPEGIHECGILEKTGKVVKECTLRHRDGHEIPVIKNASVVFDDNSSMIGVVETVTDLTALHRMRLKATVADRRSGVCGNLVGKSTTMQAIFRLIESAGTSDVTVLIQGESGTGKELVASAIHAASSRRENQMVVVNCAALPENLLESELFGHIRGAFTGAANHRIGRFESADKGTIFLDEVGELPAHIQVKLLRVLQEREIQRVGENANRSVDIRVIAATHQDLPQLVHAGKFREDLYYRLKVFPLQIPPLRQRKSDIPPLIDHFIEKEKRLSPTKLVSGVTHQSLRRLVDYPWPGNVRELENAIKHAFVLCNGPYIQIDDLPVEIQRPGAFSKNINGWVCAPFQQGCKPNRQQLLELLTATDWNKTRVARELGVSRTSIWKYMKKYDIPLKPPQEEQSAMTDGPDLGVSLADN
ncbi:hypothetical protein DSCO28_71630 [Desulfosarcina ovata subsp. sediminis]|uniref:Sigma-54-dependent Fis family transcriptional regulator n=1 Tax=Desulfosarcina ovata subsp. sediminis TaxID=885957 RepID=A0A5K8A277_9BACT|nr:sigma 54-interacting transcriptional regulator [Desulfosarcina ovata]BBO86597.1 hypothetical protein DSCO28_71630 [Desulfosarcina ovata subsp. sediminis]